MSCLTFHLYGVHFRSELQHVGDINKQKVKHGRIRTREILIPDC